MSITSGKWLSRIKTDSNSGYPSIEKQTRTLYESVLSYYECWGTHPLIGSGKYLVLPEQKKAYFEVWQRNCTFARAWMPIRVKGIFGGELILL